MPKPAAARTAVFSDCGRYRYRWQWTWRGDAPTYVFVLLNPSNGGVDKLDPTMHRCVESVRRWGGGGLVVLNLWAVVQPNAALLFNTLPDPVGPDNDKHIEAAAVEYGGRARFVLAWGERGARFDRGLEVYNLLAGVPSVGPLHALAVAANGQPAHVNALPVGLRPFWFVPQWGRLG